jgi:hypothetical protein
MINIQWGVLTSVFYSYLSWCNMIWSCPTRFLSSQRISSQMGWIFWCWLRRFDHDTQHCVAVQTLTANTSAIRSDPGCQIAQTVCTCHIGSFPMIQHRFQNMTQNADRLGSWTNMAIASDGCFLSWTVNKTTVNLFGTIPLLSCWHVLRRISGTSVPTCPNSPSTPPQFSPVILWFFTYQPVPAASATICYPNITFWDVTVNIDLASGNLTEVIPLRPFSTGSSNFSSLSANVTGAPLNGRAYNGIMFNLTNPDEFVLARQAATQVCYRTQY